MAFNVGMDERKTSGFGGRATSSIKITTNPGGNSTINIYESENPEGEEHVVSQCQKDRNKSNIFGEENEEEEFTRARLPSVAQLERNKSVVFEDEDHKTGRPSTKQQVGPPARQSSMEPSNFYDTNYRPSTKIQNPPGGRSSVTFG
ncbi:uncharacterized protein LOC134817917 [Bolinopsis microptera]|uniref:uncharacterized protein LOC134817917 n=1 Tax=Bolinopsis microptera TaxID=2820187 RepID=UPI00307B08E2